MADLSHFGYIMNENMDDEVQWSRYIVHEQLVATGEFVDSAADGLVVKYRTVICVWNEFVLQSVLELKTGFSMNSQPRVQPSFPFYGRSSLVIRPPRSPLDATATIIMVGHKARRVLIKAAFGYDELLSNAEAVCGRGI